MRLLHNNHRPMLSHALFGSTVVFIAALKTLANKKDVPYQSLVKIFLAEKVAEETAKHTRL